MVFDSTHSDFVVTAVVAVDWGSRLEVLAVIVVQRLSVNISKNFVAMGDYVVVVQGVGTYGG